MKCARCGFDNRSGARFCKQCGEALRAQATMPVMPRSSEIICPACGATNPKSGARFCLRCGKPLPEAAPDQSATQPSMPPLPPAHAATRPSMPPFATTPDHPATQPAMPTSIPPSSSAVTAPSPKLPPVPLPAKSKQGLPRWIVWAVVGFCALACVAALVIVAVFAIPRIVGGEVEPMSTEGATEILTETPSEAPTETVTMAATVAPLETATGVSKTLPEMLPQVAVAVSLSAFELRKGDLLTVTAAVTNTGEVPLSDVRCQLVGEWEGCLEAVSLPVASIPGPLEPGVSEVAIFTLRALDAGAASLQVAVTVEAQGVERSVLEGVVSERVSVTVSE